MPSAGGIPPLLSSCRTNPAVAPCGDADRCIEGSVAASGTLGLASSRLVCNPIREGRGGSDEGGMDAGDDIDDRGGVEGGIPPLLTLCGDGDRRIKVASGTLGLASSRLVCNPINEGRGGSDEGGMNAGDENCDRGGVEGGIPPLLSFCGDGDRRIKVASGTLGLG